MKQNPGLDFHVVSIQQDHSFFARRAQRHIDRGEYLEALVCYRNALTEAEQDPSVWMDIAWLYAQLQYYDMSNEILLPLLPVIAPDNPEIYYAIGSNFATLNELDLATDFLFMYLHAAPEGEYTDAAETYLDTIEEIQEASAANDPADAFLLQGIRGWHKDFANACGIQEPFPFQEDDPPTVTAAIHYGLKIAMVYQASQFPQKAKELAKALCAVVPEEPSLLYSVACICRELDMEEDALQLTQRILDIPDITESEQYQAATLLCDMHRFAQAYSILSSLMESPYEASGTQHHYAMACLFTGRMKKALSIWDRMKKIVPEDPVPDFCYQWAQSLRGETPAMEKGWTGGIPIQTYNQWLSAIHSAFQQAEPHVQTLWQDATFKKTLLDAIYAATDTVLPTLLQMLVIIAEDEAIPILRRLLVRRNVSHNTKRTITYMLNALHAPEPYVLLTTSEVAMINIEEEKDTFSPAQTKVLRGVMLAMKGRYTDYAENLQQLWFYLTHGTHAVTRNMRNIGAWQAALEYRYSIQFTGETHSLRDLAGIYLAEPSSIQTCLQQIKKKDISEDGVKFKW